MQHNHPIFSMNGKISRMKQHDGEKHPKWWFFMALKYLQVAILFCIFVRFI